MKALAGLAVLVLLSTAPALAADPPPGASAPLPTTSAVGSDKTILLIPNRRLSVTLDERMAPASAGEGEADALKFDIPKHDPKLETWFQTDGRAVFDADGLRFNLYAFDQAAGSQLPRTILAVSNGRSRDVAYFAALVIGVDGKHALRFTTICSIRPGHTGLESWGEQVEGIVVLKILETPQPTCTDARTGKFYPPGEQPPPPDPPAPK